MKRTGWKTWNLESCPSKKKYSVQVGFWSVHCPPFLDRRLFWTDGLRVRLSSRIHGSVYAATRGRNAGTSQRRWTARGAHPFSGIPAKCSKLFCAKPSNSLPRQRGSSCLRTLGASAGHEPWPTQACSAARTKSHVVRTRSHVVRRTSTQFDAFSRFSTLPALQKIFRRPVLFAHWRCARAGAACALAFPQQARARCAALPPLAS